MRLSTPLTWLLLCSLSAGCHLYLDDDGDDRDDDYQVDEDDDRIVDEECRDWSQGTSESLRNPSSGLCETFEWGSYDEPCYETAGSQAPPPSWGSCESTCQGLEEGACISDDGCRAIYMDWCPGADCSPQRLFTECWPTDQYAQHYDYPEGAQTNAHCEGMDAWYCSQFTDCSAVHQNECDQSVDLPDDNLPGACLEGQFIECMPEKIPCQAGACPSGYSCQFDGGAADQPAGGDGPVPDAGVCVPSDSPTSCGDASEMQCIERSDCTALFEGGDCSCDSMPCDCEMWDFHDCIDSAP